MDYTLTETMASMVHDIWGKWIDYMLGVCEENEDGSYTIPAEYAQRWLRQMATDYEYLTPKEQESDREIAQQYLEVAARGLTRKWMDLLLSS